MTAIPPPENTVPAFIDRWHECQLNNPRPHLGCSMLGHHCDRYLWLSFRWVFKKQFSGRMLRLFRRGQNEEATVVEDLRAIGCAVVDTDKNGNQLRVDFGRHVSGSMDGQVEGIPEAPKTWHILEIKTHNAKSFKDLTAKGVKVSKPMHWAQMQVYMLGTDLERALYFAVCKDDDSIHTERVRIDRKAAEELVQRGHRITMSDRMPEPCPGASPDWYQCKFCDAYSFCHETQTTDQANCRTCLHSTAKQDSTWHCERWGSSVPYHGQIQGCPSHAVHPDLIPHKLIGGTEDGYSAVYEVNGQQVINGEGGIPSSHFLASPELVASEPVKILSQAFNATISKVDKAGAQ